MLIKYGSLPFTEAIDYYRGKLNIPTTRWADLWKAQHDIGFMIAGATQADLLNDLRQAIDKAISQGTTLAAFRKDFDKAVAHYGWDYNGGRNWRSRIIYETNLRTAYQAGRYQQMQAIAHRRPYWRYRHSDSVANPRPQHVAWDGMILRHDDPFWQTHYPPNGWGCKCYLETLAERDLKRFGKTGPDKAPPIETYEWTDKVTGELHHVPIGIDPGWDYAPGATPRIHQVREQIQRKAKALPEPLGLGLLALLASARNLGSRLANEEPEPD